VGTCRRTLPSPPVIHVASGSPEAGSPMLRACPARKEPKSSAAEAPPALVRVAAKSCRVSPRSMKTATSASRTDLPSASTTSTSRSRIEAAGSSMDGDAWSVGAFPPCASDGAPPAATSGTGCAGTGEARTRGDSAGATPAPALMARGDTPDPSAGSPRTRNATITTSPQTTVASATRAAGDEALQRGRESAMRFHSTRSRKARLAAPRYRESGIEPWTTDSCARTERCAALGRGPSDASFSGELGTQRLMGQ